MTIIEVMVAAAVLTIGLMGAAQLLITANKSTNASSARSGANNIARRLAEAARSVGARDLTPTTVVASLKTAAPDLADSDTTDSAWTVVRRNFVYTLDATECTLDDPTDGVAPASQKDSTYCANSTAASSDSQPADARRVTVTVTYKLKGSKTETVKQVTAVPVGSNTSLPAITSLKMTAPSTCTTSCPAITTATSASFSATSTNNPAKFTWLLQGSAMASCPPAVTGCTGSGNSWSFAWSLGTPAKDTNTASPNYTKCIAGNYTYDGVYDVGARVDDANGLSGEDASLQVSVNRCAPIPVDAFNATTRNANTAVVDTVWDPSVEGDVLGYRVYKGTSTTSKTPVCPPNVSSGQYITIDAATSCTDTAPPAYSSSAYYYAITAIDRDTSGALREGAISYVNVNGTNRAPAAPTALTVAASGGRTLTWKLPAGAFDPDAGDTINAFRIYRRSGTATGAPAIADRIDRETLAKLCPSAAAGATCTYVDAAATSQSTYWVTAVDTHMRESTVLGPKTA